MNNKIAGIILSANLFVVGCGKKEVISPTLKVDAPKHIEAAPKTLDEKDGVKIARILIERRIASLGLTDLAVRVDQQQQAVDRLRKTVSDLSNKKTVLSGLAADRANVELGAAERELAINEQIKEALSGRLSEVAINEYKISKIK